MRIAMISPPWVPLPPIGYGGTEAVLTSLIEGLREARHEILLVAHPDSTLPVPTFSPSIPGRPRQMGEGVPEAAYVLAAYEHLSSLDTPVDVVHDHTNLGPLWAQRHPELAVVTTCHAPLTGSYAVLLRQLAGRAGIVAISHTQAREAQDVPVTAVVYHGVHLDSFPVGTGDGGYLLTLTRMAPEKGVASAARIARQAGVRLVIAAKMREPLEVEYFQREVRPLLGDGVEFVGEPSTDTKLELLSGAVALLNPIQWSEPFGMVMLEAMACGTPVITRPLGAAPELVTPGRSGLLGTSDDDLVAAVGQVHQIDRTEVRLAAGKFSVEQMVDGYLRVYDQVRERQHFPGARKGHVDTVADHRLGWAANARAGSPSRRHAPSRQVN